MTSSPSCPTEVPGRRSVLIEGLGIVPPWGAKWKAHSMLLPRAGIGDISVVVRRCRHPLQSGYWREPDQNSTIVRSIRHGHGYATPDDLFLTFVVIKESMICALIVQCDCAISHLEPG